MAEGLKGSGVARLPAVWLGDGGTDLELLEWQGAHSVTSSAPEQSRNRPSGRCSGADVHRGL